MKLILAVHEHGMCFHLCVSSSVSFLNVLQTGAAIVKNNMEFPEKIENENAVWPSDSNSGNTS